MKVPILLIFFVLTPARHDAKTVSCWTVLPYTWIYGEEAAEAWALSHGYSRTEVAAVRKRCKK